MSDKAWPPTGSLSKWWRERREKNREKREERKEEDEKFKHIEHETYKQTLYEERAKQAKKRGVARAKRAAQPHGFFREVGNVFQAINTTAEAGNKMLWGEGGPPSEVPDTMDFVLGKRKRRPRSNGQKSKGF